MIHRHIASEQRTVEEILGTLPGKRRHAVAIMDRLKCVTTVPEGAVVLDIGAAAGSLVLALNELGYRCLGVEPWEEARANAAQVAERLGTTIEILPGTAESLPFADGQFDVVLANSVLEHVDNIERALAEAFRVLRKGGVFWFYTASALCPLQNEIRGFPLFGWYPDRLKLAIMDWAKRRKPRLVGYSEHPAINWFTPRKARRLLRQAGFTYVHDRWDLQRGTQRSFKGRMVLGTICTVPLGRLVADILVPDCAYAAIK